MGLFFFAAREGALQVELTEIVFDQWSPQRLATDLLRSWKANRTQSSHVPVNCTWVCCWLVHCLTCLKTNRPSSTIGQKLVRWPDTLRFTYKLVQTFFSGAEHFEELVSLVKEQCLFKKALKLYPRSSEQHKVGIVQLGDWRTRAKLVLLMPFEW